MARQTAKALRRPEYSVKQFYLDDLMRTLFPLTTNKVLVSAGHDELLAFAQSLIADKRSFLPQRRVYASKDQLHLRRTVKLDPVAELYLYDLIFRNRKLFRNLIPQRGDIMDIGLRRVGRLLLLGAIAHGK